jgi:hypothetical protein
MWRVYADLARDLIDDRRREAERARVVRTRVDRRKRGSLLHRLLGGREES